MNPYTYEEAVNWMRNQTQNSEFVKQCYLDSDNLTAARRFAQSEEFEAMVNLLSLDVSNQALKILDLGCGNGIASYAFASLGHEVIAVDPNLSNDVGLQATHRLSEHIQNGSISVTQAFAESLPFQDASFDIVYARQALHHFSDLNQGLKECFRVLNPNGFFLATREHLVSDSDQLQEFLSNHVLHQMHGGENAYPSTVYFSALKQAGFKKIKPIAPYASVINHFPLSNSGLRSELLRSLQNKYGNTVARSLVNVPMVESLYRRYRSNQCNIPGRLYSFFCIK